MISVGERWRLKITYVRVIGINSNEDKGGGVKLHVFTDIVLYKIR